tara:strand:- start:10724 stop:11080 length:357 start_codon:yes stop_codon:yes gene_type:complete
MASKNVLKMKIEKLIEVKYKYDTALKNVEMLRTEKNNIEQEINNMLQSLNMEGKTIIVNNHKIVQRKSIISQNLTFKYIETVLEQYNDSFQKILNIKELLNFIKTNRPKYVKHEIKFN